MKEDGSVAYAIVSEAGFRMRNRSGRDPHVDSVVLIFRAKVLVSGAETVNRIGAQVQLMESRGWRRRVDLSGQGGGTWGRRPWLRARW